MSVAPHPACPHCGKEIRLYGQTELSALGLNANSVQYASRQGRFPTPWLQLNNRHLYLAADIDRYVEERTRTRVEQTVKELMASLAHLPEADREAARRLLDESLPTTSKKR